jgi:preprotein translocase subunit SecG
MIYGFFVFVHIVVCLFLIIVVLLQSGKAADLAGAFGGMGSQTAFGPRGSATILSKATTVSAGLFMVTSLTLAIMASSSAGVGSTVLESHPAAPARSAPSRPVPQAPGAPTVGGGAAGSSQTQSAPMPAPRQPGVPAQTQPAPAQPAPPK